MDVKKNICCLKCKKICCPDCNAAAIKGCGKFGAFGLGVEGYFGMTKGCERCGCGSQNHEFFMFKDGKCSEWELHKQGKGDYWFTLVNFNINLFWYT